MSLCKTCALWSGDRCAGAVHPPLHQCQPEPAGGREGAEGENEDWTDPGNSAPEDLQRLRSGGSVSRLPNTMHKDSNKVHFI